MSSHVGLVGGRRRVAGQHAQAREADRVRGLAVRVGRADRQLRETPLRRAARGERERRAVVCGSGWRTAGRPARATRTSASRPWAARSPAAPRRSAATGPTLPCSSTARIAMKRLARRRERHRLGRAGGGRRGRAGDGLRAGEVRAGDRVVRLHDLVVVGGAAQQVVAGRLEGQRVRRRSRASYGLPGQRRVAAVVAGVREVVVERRPRAGRAGGRVGRSRRARCRRASARSRPCARALSVSCVPNEPITGLATVQSDVGFGHFGRGRRARRVEREQVERCGAADDLLAGQPVDVGDRRPGDELQVVDRPPGSPAGTGRWSVSQAATKSWPPWYSLTPRSSARSTPAAGVRNEGAGAAEVAERRVADGRDRGRVVLAGAGRRSRSAARCCCPLGLRRSRRCRPG